MRHWVRTGESTGQEHAAAQTRKPEPLPDADRRQAKVITRVWSHRNAKIELIRPQLITQANQFSPRPAAQVVFSPKGRPRRSERDDSDLRTKYPAELHGIGLGQQSHVEMVHRRLEESSGDGQVPKPPKLHHQKFLLHANFKITADAALAQAVFALNTIPWIGLVHFIYQLEMNLPPTS